MNPRHRRLLIPGLLLALLVVVLVVSLVRKADAAETPTSTPVSTMTDARITESSGLAVSHTHDDLGYTINDSGDSPRIFAVRLSTGATVGVTTVAGVAWRDTEALSLDGHGTLWVADTGDNTGTRHDVALYSLDEPGAGDHTSSATRYPIAYSGGPRDVESLAIDPRSGAKLLVTKELLGGSVLRLPAKLSTDRDNVPRDTGWDAPLMATDASWSPDGRSLLVRNYVSVSVLDTRTGRLVREQPLPSQPQGETIAFERSGQSFLIGSEGSRSQLLRLGFERASAATATAPTATPSADSAQESSVASPTGQGQSSRWWLGAAGAVALVVAALVVALLRRRAAR